MRKHMLIALSLAASLASWAGAALAQATPAGLWKTIDDETGKEKSFVRISDAGGGLMTGKVEKIIDPTRQDARCDKCTDARKDQPIVGMTLFVGAKPDGDDKDIWSDTQILKPEDGKLYRLRLKMLDGGKRLQVRGYIGPFYKTQEWIRVE